MYFLSPVPIFSRLLIKLYHEYSVYIRGRKAPEIYWITHWKAILLKKPFSFLSCFYIFIFIFLFYKLLLFIFWYLVILFSCVVCLFVCLLVCFVCLVWCQKMITFSGSFFLFFADGASVCSMRAHWKYSCI